MWRMDVQGRSGAICRFCGGADRTIRAVRRRCDGDGAGGTHGLRDCRPDTEPFVSLTAPRSTHGFASRRRTTLVPALTASAPTTTSPPGQWALWTVRVAGGRG